MAKPVINNINSFDTLKGATVTFSIGSDVSYGNKIWIYDTATLNLVYEYPRELTAGKDPVPLTCVIPANILTNGSRYYCQVQVIDENGIQGLVSEKSVFYCLATPDFRFVNVVDGMSVDASHLDVECIYHQPNGEKIQSYRFSLYDKNKVLLSESPLIFYSQNPDMTYRYKGLSTGQSYYVSASCLTTKGLTADTGMIEVKPDYVLKKDFAQISLKNNYYAGTVEIDTKIKLIGFTLDNDDYAFIANEYLNLLTADPTKKTVLLYDNGFTIDGAFSAWMKFYSARPNEPLLSIYNNDGQMVIVTAHRVDDYYYFKLSVEDGSVKYIRYSERLPYSKSKIYTLFMRKNHDDLWTFKAYDRNASGVVTDDYGFTIQDGRLYLNYNGAMPAYELIDPSLYTGESDVWYDAASGNLYRVI